MELAQVLQVGGAAEELRPQDAVLGNKYEI